MSDKIGPRQANKKGNERFPGPAQHPHIQGGNDRTDREVGEDKIQRKGDAGGGKPLTDDGHDPNRDREWIIAPET